MWYNFGSSKNLMETPVSVFNHGKHGDPHSRDTEGSAKETFGHLAGMCPSSIYRCFRMGNHRLKCVKHPFYSHFRAAQGAFPSVPWSRFPLKTPKSQRIRFKLAVFAKIAILPH
jgi:hypothetical protein